MGVSDQIIQMRAQGITDQDIILQLQEQGVAPKTINDALNQANIKGAIGEMEEPKTEITYGDDYTPVPQPQENYAPKAEGYPTDDFYVSHSQTAPSAYSYRETPPQAYQEFYPQGQGYAEAGIGTDTDTMIEIAQQVFSEKIKKMQQHIEELNEFKTLYQTKVDGIYERLKRMESIIDRLQSAILEKIGSYGEGIESVKKEFSMMQDTYGKIVGAIAEKHHEHHASQASHPNPISHSKPHHVKKISKKHSKKKK